MKISDNLGRSVDVALVAKPPLSAKFSGGLDWTRPLFHEIAGSNKLFVRMPVGQFALRVMSTLKTELMLHVDGKLALRTEVPNGLQYIDRDASGNYFIFAKPGDEKPFIPASDYVLQAPTAVADANDVNSANLDAGQGESQPELFTEETDSYVQMPLLPESTPGSVFVVLRFVDEPGPGLKPPAQEFEVTFQMNSPADHDLLVAEKHLLTMVKPEPLINSDDETSFEPPQGHLPTFTCTCTGCVRNGH